MDPLFQRFAPIFFPSLHRIEKRKVIQIDGFPITLLKEEGLLCLSSLDPCTFFFSVFHSTLLVLFVSLLFCFVAVKFGNSLIF